MKDWVVTVLACGSVLVAGVGAGVGVGELTHALAPKHHAATQASSVVYIKITAGDIQGHGSGVDIGDGYVLTAAHVADHQPADDDTGTAQSNQPAPKTTLSVTDSLGKAHDVQVLWVNHTYDVALLKIGDAANVAASNLACHATYQLGEKLSFAGNPSFVHDVTTFGQVGNPNIITAGPWKAAVTISGTLIPGMSGGPAYDVHGDVVGINVGVADVPGMGPFAMSWIVPSQTICMLMGRG